MSAHHRRHGLKGKRWERLRREVLDAAGWRCCKCNAYGNHVDHIRPLHLGGAAWDPGNLQVLCREDHHIKTRKENRRKLTPGELEWRRLVEGLSAGDAD